MVECIKAQKVRVLIVDDSAFSRWALSRKLDTDPEIEIIGFANDGIEALEKIKSLKPAVITLDLQMPRMDGLTTLRRIMSECPTPVVIVSSLVSEEAKPTIEALELGAVDFFQKLSPSNPAGNDKSSLNLLNIVKQAAGITGSRLKPGEVTAPAEPIRKVRTIQRNSQVKKVVVIGCSTGGPRALCELIPSLPADLPAAVLIVQHMPPGFTQSLSKRLDEMSRIEVREAKDKDMLRQGLALVAPGGFHMALNQHREIILNREPPVCNVRPSVDVTMMSVTSLYGVDTVGVVLTGMGSDGARGSACIKAAGGAVLVEDASTCTVYGMPKIVADHGDADKILPLPKLANEIVQICSRDQTDNNGVKKWTTRNIVT